ncbi:hypothetical protein [Dyella sp.]|uniref:hypothetical protein n=1 Tax=Dyella sp. TaxID=1869338 RepID=UPI002D79C0F6|nr:hypothetical protein [Dyella sp.]HET7332938.1 hypothetical protein [Dyella sp.]
MGAQLRADALAWLRKAAAAMRIHALAYTALAGGWESHPCMAGAMPHLIDARSARPKKKPSRMLMSGCQDLSSCMDGRCDVALLAFSLDVFLFAPVKVCVPSLVAAVRGCVSLDVKFACMEPRHPTFITPSLIAAQAQR